MASVKFSLDNEYSSSKVQFLDEESFEFQYFDQSAFPELVERIDFKKLNFVFELENPSDDGDGYSLVCTNSHRKKATKCSVQVSQTGDNLELKLVAIIEVPLRADPADVKHLKLWLKRLDCAKGSPEGFSIEFEHTKAYVPFAIE